ncbi:hypothetical protein OAL41_03240, partial [Nitrosopumilus sp.]|nr:hypothetical protein [Nitrosopumilus sp.]
SGSSLFIDDKIVFSSSQERYSRIKSDESYPVNSIEDGLKSCNINSADLDNVIIAGNNISLIPVLLRIFSSFSVEDHLRTMTEYWYPSLVKNESVNILDLFEEKISKNQYPFNSSIFKEFDLTKISYPMNPENEQYIINLYKKSISEHLEIDQSIIRNIDHHTCHAAYAFYGSPIRDDNTVILTADGWGDDLSASISIYDKEHDKINRVKEYNHKIFQLARIYRYTTLFLRMKPNEHEYKVMGLASYYDGNKIAEVEKVFESIQTLNDLDFKFNSNIKDIYNYLVESLQSFRFDHISAGLQSFTEKLLTKWTKNILKYYNSDKLVFSGGLSMNVKANMKISQLDEVKKFFVCGGGGDESLAMGACYSHAESQNLKISPLQNLYLGTDASYKKSELTQQSKYRVLNYESPTQIVDRLLDGKIIATCFGRAEMGPRALGNRSILADPRNTNNIDKINQKIKNRDFWMPFAPIILHEYKDKLILNPKKLDSPFMTIGFETIEGKEKIPAAIHRHDGTARPEILKKEVNSKLWHVINGFYDVTGIPALLNTSFNLHGEPLVNSLDDAFHVFDNSGLDALWLEKHIIEKI